MKRFGPWVNSVVALASAGLLAVGPAHAAPRCSMGTLKGLYMFANSGYTPVNNNLVPLALSGKDIFFGNGKFDSLAAISIGGTIVPGDAAPGTYTLGSDCVGTAIVHMKRPTPDVHLELFVAPDGSEIFNTETDAGTVLSGTLVRVAR